MKEYSSLHKDSEDKLLADYKALSNGKCFSINVHLHSFLWKRDHIKRHNYSLELDVAFLITSKLNSSCEWRVDRGRMMKEWDFYWGTNSIGRIITGFAASKPFLRIKNTASRPDETITLYSGRPPSVWHSLILSAIDWCEYLWWSPWL